MSTNKRNLKNKLKQNPRLYDDPYMWRLIQNEMEQRTKMNPSLFNEVVNG